MFDDDRPTRIPVHEIGSDLSLLSVGDLRDRIDILKQEITRIEMEIGAKTSSRGAAESFFKQK